MNKLVISYLILRRAIGTLGILFPFILAIGGIIVFKTGLQDSISGYYHTRMQDVFVGILCAIGLFLFSYKGHEKEDDIFGHLACLFAVGVAWFPMAPTDDPVGIVWLVGLLHWVFAACLFLTFAYFSLVLFVKSDQKEMKQPKRARNHVYRICGTIILVAIALIAAEALLPEGTQKALSVYRPVFWLEAIAVVTFGFSWLVKGGTLWKDPPESAPRGEITDTAPTPA